MGNALRLIPRSLSCVPTHLRKMLKVRFYSYHAITFIFNAVEDVDNAGIPS